MRQAPIVTVKKTRAELLAELKKATDNPPSTPKPPVKNRKLHATGWVDDRLRLEVVISSKMSPWVRTVLGEPMGPNIIKQAVDAALDKLRMEAGKPNPTREYAWTGIPLEARLQIIAELRSKPIPWVGVVKDLRARYGINQSQAHSMVFTLAAYGPDDPYLSGAKPLDDLASRMRGG